MRNVIYLPLLLSLAACSSSPAEFSKTGASAHLIKEDSDACWKQAQTAVSPEDRAAKTVAGAGASLLLGGPAVMVGTLVGNAIADQDPKNAERTRAHDACMASKGYKSSG